MPNIVINEIDMTTPGVASESTDIVYIPGFVNLDQNSLYELKTENGATVRGTFLGLEYGKPQLFTSTAQFISKCGKEAPTFKDAQYYSNLSFDAKATYGGLSTMFDKGEADPSYVMAKELLSSGISVLYERVNKGDAESRDEYVKVSSEIEAPLVGLIAKEETEFFYLVGKNYLRYGVPTGTSPILANRGTTELPDYDAFSVNTIVSTNITEEQWSDNVLGTEVPFYKTLYSKNTATGEYAQIFAGDETADFTEAFATNYPTVYTFTQVSAVPADWDTNFTAYCKQEVNKMIPYSSDDLEYKAYEQGNIYLKTVIYDISAANMYQEMNRIFDASNSFGLLDKGVYSVKYLTSGGYPTFEYDSGSLVTSMLKMAEKRGDCVALIDHTDNQNRPIDPENANSVYKVLQDTKDSYDDGEFGTMFTPWATYNRVSSDVKFETVGEKTVEKRVKKAFRAPGSFAYLASLADSIKTNANWLAIAGAARGGIKNLAANGMTTNIPNGVADAMQPRSNAIAVNAITNINPYGMTIWGNRTLKPIEENLVATDFLNIRNLISDIKKTCYRAARKATFEQDTDILWVNFKSEIARLLDRMKSGYGISGYKIVRDYDHEKAPENATLCAKIIIYPTYAVEDFYITVILQDDEVTVQ